MKRQYLNPTIEVHKLSCENLLDGFSQNSETAPEAPDGTEAGQRNMILTYGKMMITTDNNPSGVPKSLLLTFYNLL